MAYPSISPTIIRKKGPEFHPTLTLAALSGRSGSLLESAGVNRPVRFESA